jgi:hypothetical protein
MRTPTGRRYVVPSERYKHELGLPAAAVDFDSAAPALHQIAAGIREFPANALLAQLVCSTPTGRPASQVHTARLRPPRWELVSRAAVWNELERGLTEDGAAQALGWPKQRVTARVKLLELPEQAQQLTGQGVIPLSAVEQLRSIGQVSPELLEAVIATWVTAMSGPRSVYRASRGG